VEQSGDWLGMSTHKRVIWLSALVMTGAGSYFLVLFMLGFRLRDFSRRAA